LAFSAGAVALQTPNGLAAEPHGPGGRSRAFHVDCGLFCLGGSPVWAAEHDDAWLATGYTYSVTGNSYANPSRPRWNCWFFTDRGTVTIRCPEGVEGKLHLYFLDLGSSERRQTVAVGGQEPEIVESFAEPPGKWCEYRLSKVDTADGTILIEIVRQGGANAVISRIDFVPDGLEDALLAEEGPGPSSPEQMVEWDWRRQEHLRRRAPGCLEAVQHVLSRGAALVEDFRRLGAVDIAQEATEKLVQLRHRQDELAQAEATGQTVAVQWDKLYLEARWMVRETSFQNPLLDFDELLFVKRYTPPPAHQCSHHVGSAQRPGADLCILKGLRPDGQVRTVLGDQLPPGAIGRPDLSFDAETIVFPYSAPRTEPTPYPIGLPDQTGGACLDYQIYEMGVDGRGLRKLTDGPSENTEPCYLPDGRICFTSSRCERFVQCGDWAIVFSLCAMNRDGTDVVALTEAKEGEWFPSVLDDGRIIYMRWEYVIKPFNTIQYLWTVNPNGTGAKLAYGEHYAFSPGPISFIEARQIPGTSKVIATGAAHHNAGVGPICIVDLRENRGRPDGLLRVTPEVGYPETAEMPNTVSQAGWYSAPWPLSETCYLAGYSFEPAHNAPAGYGIYLMDIHGNKELIYRDPDRSCYSPVPLKPRKVPPVLPPEVEHTEPTATGTMVMSDVYQGLNDVPRGTIKYLRVLESVCKDVHSVPQRLDLGIGSGWDPRAVLGTVQVEEDGSACFEVPARKAIFFQALDENYMLVQGMRSFVSVQPGETIGCVGCHESYRSAPARHRRPSAALAKPPQEIAPPPWGTCGVSFPQLVQPILDRHCVRCHDGTQGDKKSFDVTGGNWVSPEGPDNHYPPAPSDPYRVTTSFVTLLEYVDVTRLSGYGGGNLPVPPYAVGSHRSRLVQLLDAGHYDVHLDPAESRALIAWIDCNAPFLGNWDEYPPDGAGK
jgi:hypothetical protein